MERRLDSSSLPVSSEALSVLSCARSVAQLLLFVFAHLHQVHTTHSEETANSNLAAPHFSPAKPLTVF